MHEIIHVIDPESLAGKFHPDLEVEAVNDRPLAEGYYFVVWPTQTRLSRNAGKRYFGPFQTLVQARMIQRSAWAMGIVQDEKVVQAVAECRSIVCRPAASTAPVFSLDHSRRRQEVCTV